MRERPILFGGPMVRAILEGRKAQTRRVVKPQPVGNADVQFQIGNAVTLPPDGKQLCCPYGKPGDRLWVRENLTAKDGFMVYAADGARVDCGAMDWPACIEKRKTIPSIHMPRWASRILLEVIGVRIERLNEISAPDCIAEGVNVHHDHYDKSDASIYSVISAYYDLWTNLNGPGSWEENPWVWVIEFKRVTP